MRASLILIVLCLIGYCSYAQGGIDLKTLRQHYRDSLPPATNYVNDFENIYTEGEEKMLNDAMAAFEKETTNQLCIITLDTILVAREDFDGFASYVAGKWGIGKSRHSGVTICISKGYRRMRIYNGSGVADIISDENTKQIIDEDFIPRFKEGRYYAGTMNGIKQIMNRLHPK